MTNHQRGFTLLEVMLAIAIFSVLSFLASTIFSQAGEQHQRAQKLANDFHALQYTLLLLENDLMQYVPRKNRQTHQTFTSGTDELLFSTQMRDATTPFDAAFILTTVHWYVKDGTLYRAVRYSPDGKKDKPARTLLTNISHFSSEMLAVEDDTASATVAITLERENHDSVRRVFILPGWVPDVQQADQHREDKK